MTNAYRHGETIYLRPLERADAPRVTPWRAVRCYEKVGFKHEGVQRHSAFREGAYHDLHLMALLRDEWRW